MCDCLLIALHAYDTYSDLRYAAHINLRQLQNFIPSALLVFSRDVFRIELKVEILLH